MTSSNRSAYLFISSSVYFVVCLSTLLCIFLPKFFRLRNNRHGTTAVDVRGSSSVTGLTSRARNLRNNIYTMDIENFAAVRNDEHLSMRERLKVLRAEQKNAKQKKNMVQKRKEEQSLVLSSSSPTNANGVAAQNEVNEDCLAIDSEELDVTKESGEILIGEGVEDDEDNKTLHSTLLVKTHNIIPEGSCMNNNDQEEINNKD